MDAIWDYSAENWGPDQADYYTGEIRNFCLALASGRKRGRAADVRPGYLKLTAGSHIIYYREHADRIEVIRILHVRQDSERHL